MSKKQDKSGKQKGWFICFAEKMALWTGKSYVFLSACAILVIWGITGPFFHYSDTWQLVINTATSLITFLMVFLIQNTQNRDSRAVQLKLDELIRATKGAHTVLLDLEELDDAHLQNIFEQYEKIAKVARERMKAGKSDTNIPSVILDKPLKKQ